MATQEPPVGKARDPMNDAETTDYVPLVTDADASRPPALSAAVRIDLGARSHRGKVRPNNEDHFLAVRFGRSLVTLRSNVPDGLVPDRFDETGYGFVVADGMGGAAAGEVASRLAISVGVNLALNAPKWNLLTRPEEIRENMDKWRHRFRQIDAVLAERAADDPALAGMGTTLTVACSVGTDLLLYYVGNSRVYLFRRGQLHRLTRDHTRAQELADAGWIGPEEVARHRLRHVLTRVLGRGGGEIEAEIQHLHLADGDRLLVCTDGLTDLVPDAGIAEVLRHTESSEPASQALLDLALDAGGTDNVTVVLARYTIPTLPPAAGDEPQAGPA
jgi:PPM family protein phosphatase